VSESAAPAAPRGQVLTGLRGLCHLVAIVVITVWALLAWPLPWPGLLAAAGFLVLSVLLWALVLKSGVHATLAGVVTGLLIPHYDRGNAIDDAIERLDARQQGVKGAVGRPALCHEIAITKVNTAPEPRKIGKDRTNDAHCVLGAPPWLCIDQAHSDMRQVELDILGAERATGADFVTQQLDHRRPKRPPLFLRLNPHGDFRRTGERHLGDLAVNGLFPLKSRRNPQALGCAKRANNTVGATAAPCLMIRCPFNPGQTSGKVQDEAVGGCFATRVFV